MIVSDYTKGLCHDKWIGGVLHYTGMGKSGDQDIHWAQNATLAACGRNGVDVHLFEVMDAGEYVYCGRIELVDKPWLRIIGLDETIEVPKTARHARERMSWTNIASVFFVDENEIDKSESIVIKDQRYDTVLLV